MQYRHVVAGSQPTRLPAVHCKFPIEPKMRGEWTSGLKSAAILLIYQ